MAGRANRSEAVTPILEGLLKMTNIMQSQNTDKNTNATKSGEKSDRAETLEPKKKASQGQTVKNPVEKAETVTNGGSTDKDKAPRPEIAVHVEQRAAATSREKSTDKAIESINASLLALSNTVKELTKSVNSVDSQVKSVKQKQDFLEASWEDPEFEYQYDAAKGSFRHCISEDEEDIEATVSEPPQKRQRKEGEGGDSEAPSTSQAAESHVTTPAKVTHADEWEQAKASTSTVSESGTSLLNSMKDNFQLEEKVGPPINKELAEIVDGFLSKGCAPDSINKMNYARPANIEFLQKVKVNPTLWSTLSKSARINDIKYQNLHESLMLGIIPLIQVTNICVNASDKKELIHPEEMFKKLTDSVAVLTDTCHEIGLARRRALKPNVKEQYRALCGQKTEITTELFGDNLPSVAKDLGEMSKLANTIGYSDRGGGFRGRKNFRRGGFNGGNRGRGTQGFFSGQRQGPSPGYRGRGTPAPRRPDFHRGRRGAV